jgi:hypothetical protein
MGLDWKTNSLHHLDTHYSKMLAQFQLATDPFTNEIDGDLHPCLLASKASQANNPTFEEAVDPTCVKSRSGFAIGIANCPVIWSSKLQGDKETSTMESEYSALSSAMRDLFPLRELLITLLQSISAKGCPQSTFRTTVHEDNAGALSLANLEPGRSTPRSKHYAVKLHWFRSKLDSEGPHPITVEKISTDIQRVDILTKGLSRVRFQTVRRLLCGW